MYTNPNADIDTIKNNNYVFKIQFEIDYLKSKEKTFGLTPEEIESRIVMLENMLAGKMETRKKTITEQKNDMFQEFDKYAFKKQWNKLQSIHKNVKIKEFIEDAYGKGEMQTNIINDLSKYVNDNKINTKKYVVYDPNIGKILTLTCLTIDLENKTYTINI